MEDEILNPTDPRPFIQLKTGRVYKENYKPLDNSYADTFEEYAKQMGAKIELDPFPADPEEIPEGAVDVGTTKATGTTAKAIDLNRRAREASAQVTEQTEIDAIAEAFFNIEGAGPKYIYDQEGGKRIEPDLKAYLGDAYPLYAWYQKTGKLELSLVPQEIKDKVVDEAKERAREIVYRETGEGEVLNKARAMKIEGGAALLEQRKRDVIDYERLTGMPLVREEKLNGRIFRPPYFNLTEDPQVAKIQKQQKADIEVRIQQTNQAADDWGVRQEEYLNKVNEINQRIDQGKVVVPGEIYSLQIEQIDLNRAAADLNLDINRINESIDNIQINNEELVSLAKNYDKMDKLAVVLEDSFVGSSVMLGSKFLEYGLAAMEGTADFFNLEGAQLQIQEAQAAAARGTYTAINYNERLKDQLQYKFPKPLESSDESSVGAYMADIAINNFPSIVAGLGTIYGTGGAGAALASTAFFVMEAGGKIADMEITQKNASGQLKILNAKLEAATTNMEKATLKKQINYYENALSFTELQKGFAGIYNGGIATFAERLGGATIFRNFQKMARGYGRSKYKKLMSDAMADRFAKGTGITIGTIGGVAIEEVEEFATGLGQNFGDIIFLNEDKSLIEGIDTEFFINVAVTSFALQGSGIASNIYNAILSEISTNQERAEFNELRDKLISVQARIKEEGLSVEEKEKLKEERRNIIREASAKVTISHQKLRHMSEEDVELLFETNANLRKIRREAQELAANREVGEYGDARLKELKARYDEEFAVRNALLGEAQAQREAEIKEILEAQEGDSGALKLNLKGGVKSIEFTPEVNFNIGLYNLAKDIARNSGVPFEINNEFEQSAGFDGKKITINESKIFTSLLVSDRFNARIAAVSPLHEVGHARVKEKQIFKDKKIAQNSLRLIDDFKFYTAQQLDFGRITQEQHDQILNRLNAYLKIGDAKTNVDELFQLINDLTNTGVFKKSSLAGLSSIKQTINSVLQNIFGDSFHLFTINNIKEARAFAASYANKTSGVQLPDDEADDKKFSLSDFNNKIKEARSDQAYKKKVNNSYNANKDLWADKESRTGQRRRENFIAEQILNDDGKIMQLMGYYVDRPQPKTGAAPFSSLPGFERDLYLITAKNELLRHAVNFDEAKNDDIHGWIVSQAYNKALQAVKRLGIDTAGTLSLEEEGVQKQVKAEVAQEEAPKRETAIEKAVAASATNFIREINKAVPGFLSGEVLERFYGSIDKFIKDPANTKKLKFEGVPGTNKIIVQPEAAAEFQKLLSEYLIKELSDYFRNDILKRNKSAFGDIVKETFKIYKLIPQSFLNKRIANWVQPLIDPRTGKQARTTTEMGGKYGGAKGNPLFERIEITQEDWINYFNNPTAKPSTKTALKKRFAEMLASGVGTDLFLRYLNETDAEGNLANLQQFINQQGLPVYDGANAYGITLTEALGRNIDAVKLKYSLNTTEQYLNFLENLDDIVKQISHLNTGSKKLIKNVLINTLDKKYFTDATIDSIATKISKDIPRIKSTIKKAKTRKPTDEETIEILKQRITFRLVSGNLQSAFDIADIDATIKDIKGNVINENAYNEAITGVINLLNSEQFTFQEIQQHLLAALSDGGRASLFNNNKEFYNAIGDSPINNSGAEAYTTDKGIVKFKPLDGGSYRGLRGIEIRGSKINKAFKEMGIKNAIRQINLEAIESQNFIIKLADYYKKEAEQAETLEERKIKLLQATIIFNALANYTNSPMRKAADIRLVQENISGKFYFEHLLPTNVMAKFVGLYISGKITKENLMAQFNIYQAAIIDEKAAGIIDAVFRDDQPIEYNIGEDPIARLKFDYIAGQLAELNVVLKNPFDAADTFDFNNLMNVESKKETLNGQENLLGSFVGHRYYPLKRVLKYSLNTDLNINFYPQYPDGNTSKSPNLFISDEIKIGPLEEDQSYVITLAPSKRGDKDILFFAFSLKDGLEDPNWSTTGTFARSNINPIKLFGAIGNAVISFIQNQNKFEGIEFSGDGFNRVRVYDRFADLMAKKLGWELETQEVYGEFDQSVSKEYAIDSNMPSLKYSLNDLNKDFNLIIEDKFGIEEYKRFSEVVGKRRGAKKDRLNFKNFFFPPSAEDFMGLMYDMLGKGEKGDAQKQWFMDNIVMPYTIGIAQLDSARQNIRGVHRNLLTENAGIKKILRQKIVDGDFTFDQAIRVYLWNLKGVEIPGLSERDQKKLTELVAQSDELKDFAGQLLALANMEQGWPDPSEYWDTETLLSDLNNLTQKANRKIYLKEFIENVDTIFSPKNKNKLRAALGNNWVEALEDIIYRMKNGTNRPAGANRIVNAWNNWVNRSIGAIMFFNRRSALLQTLSTVNFINWSDNNPINAAIAFANQKQYWKDFTMIFNSDKLKERRGGLRMDVSEAEIANAAAESKNDPGAILSYLLKIGFTLTQIADSFAISSGGATFYRNRVKTYLDQDLEKEEAETKAFQDFSRISDETQQSSDPMLISQEQASVLGRLILAFQNTSAQYTRRGRKGIRDLIMGRGDFKTNLSVSIYYLAVQNLMFNALQNALFTFIPGFDDEPEDETLTEKELERKQKRDASTKARAINGSLDTVLRGMGLRGAVIATLKNTILKYYEQQQKDPFFKDNAQIVLEGLNISPPIGSKARKFYNALRTADFEKDVITERGLDLFIDGRFKPSPLYSVIGNISAAFANVPLDRAYDEVVSISEAFDQRNSEWQRLALGLGYKSWAVGAKQEEEDLIKQTAKALRKARGIEKAKKTRAENKAKKEAEERAMIEKMSIDEYIKYLNEQKKKKKK